ncbi:hypothetical protein OUZ56_019522 [Daphnia magna]|uniref:Beta-1,4-N-acetylgalactosaminyltransferase n=1 Tax=Daphnia magna TaxID=35525 RepID=A0ABQ9ZBT8_9CRUS|nr:hypothetical protein OUZ56_019522 [Daphnia magna]
MVCFSRIRVLIRPLFVSFTAISFIFWFYVINSLLGNSVSIKRNSPTSHQSNPIKSCPLISPKLVGRINLSSEAIAVISEEDEDVLVSRMTGQLKAGGMYKPSGCKARSRVAIIVPYQNRKSHLTLFLRYLHPFLQRQQLSYVIIVVEQFMNGAGRSPFNRGMLMNIGFKEARLLPDKYECFIFHDVDLLPEDDRNPYTCPESGKPRQMAFSIDYWDNYRPTPSNHFGGVTAFRVTDFQLVNGFSNSFWGWGGEDDQLYQRVRFHNLTVVRAFDDQPSLVHLARYKTLSHVKAKPNPSRKEILKEGPIRYKTDGLINLRYHRVDLQLRPLFTHIVVDIQPKQRQAVAFNRVPGHPYLSYPYSLTGT